MNGVQQEKIRFEYLTQTMWKVVKSRRALIASLASIVGPTQTGTIRFIANLSHRSDIAITQAAHSISVIAISAFIAA